MNFVILVLSGVAMGLIAAVPIGPVNLICIRRTFAFGPLNGFVSGLGAALGDGIFAAITVFGLTWIAQLIKGYAPLIELVGGALLVWFGYRIFTSPAIARVEENCPEKGKSSLVRAMVSTFALTITNPITLLSFTVMSAPVVGLTGNPPDYAAAGLVVAGVVGGSSGWWLVLTTVIGLFHTRIDEKAMRTINKATGALVVLCGLGVLIHLVPRTHLPF